MDGHDVLVVLWCIFLTMKLVEGRDGCKDLQYLSCINNKKFRGHVIDSFRFLAPGLEQCQNKCYHDDRCISYNLGPVERQIRTCELNEFDHVTHPNDVIDQQGSDYCPIKNPCSSNPCPGKVCVPDFYWDSFNCRNGIWSQWSPWCKCPTTRSRVRFCRNPFTNATASDCPSHDHESNHNKVYQKIPKNCSDASECGCRISGVYTFPSDNGDTKYYCDQQTDGGGWTVIQKRKDGSVDFYRGWQDYKVGFGNLTGEFWLGLDKIYRLTHQIRNRLRVDLESDYAEYDYFAVSDEANNYKLNLGNYAGGNAGDSLIRHANQPFSTKDRNHDTYAGNCAVEYKGAWWYVGCHNSNLNGLYLNGTHSSYGNGINWKTWKSHYYSAKTAEMKIRPT